MRSAAVASVSLFVVVVAVPTPEAWGETVTLQEGAAGYSGSTDSFLYREAPSINYDQSGYLRLYYYEQAG